MFSGIDPVRLFSDNPNANKEVKFVKLGGMLPLRKFVVKSRSSSFGSLPSSEGIGPERRLLGKTS